MSNTNLPRGNKQIAFRVEPQLEQAMREAMKIDGDESISAWIKRIIRKELQSRGIESNS
ncbi:hypothetical protein [Xenorhabdus doucetiae]|uniref:Uncharacterized protein n=1 Tax=Xenorhabdus doucetiae TaxID=351671 RepID=A0A068QRH0_9GAMM|nr:hypothetical protein [Xenorhabdus doucetiae]CDG17379.1 conserved protein of unknown function [Xenorhabdus doucetiae]